MPGGSGLTRSLLRFRVKSAAPEAPELGILTQVVASAAMPGTVTPTASLSQPRRGQPLDRVRRNVTGTGFCGGKITVACGVAGGGWTVRGQGPAVGGVDLGTEALGEGSVFHTRQVKKCKRVLTPPPRSSPAETGFPRLARTSARGRGPGGLCHQINR